MKKIVLLLFFCFLALWCFADESLPIGEINESLLLSSFPAFSFGLGGVSTFQTPMFDYSLSNVAMRTGSFEVQADLGLTRYADYKPDYSTLNTVLEVTSLIVGVVALFGGALMMADGGTGSNGPIGAGLLLGSVCLITWPLVTWILN